MFLSQLQSWIRVEKTGQDAQKGKGSTELNENLAYDSYN